MKYLSFNPISSTEFSLSRRVYRNAPETMDPILQRNEESVEQALRFIRIENKDTAIEDEKKLTRVAAQKIIQLDRARELKGPQGYVPHQVVGEKGQDRFIPVNLLRNLNPVKLLERFWNSKGPMVNLLKEGQNMVSETIQNSPLRYSETLAALWNDRGEATLDSIDSGGLGQRQTSLSVLNFLDTILAPEKIQEKIEELRIEEIREKQRAKNAYREAKQRKREERKNRPNVFRRMWNWVTRKNTDTPPLEPEVLKNDVNAQIIELPIDKSPETLFEIMYKDIKDRREEGMQQLEAEEWWKFRFFSKPLLRWISKIGRNQLLDGVMEMKEIIDRMKVEKRKNIDDVLAALDKYQFQAEQEGNRTKKNKLWRFMYYITYNPHEFLKSPTYARSILDWKNELGEHIETFDLLDAIREKHIERVVSVDRTEELYQDMNSTLKNIDERAHNIDQILPKVDYDSLYTHWISEVGIENHDEEISIRDMVHHPRYGLHTVLNEKLINIQTEVYDAKDPILMTDGEKLGYLVAYLNDNIEIADDLDDESKSAFVGFVYSFESTTRERYVTGVLTEKPTAYTRILALKLANTAQESAADVLSFINHIDEFVDQFEKKKEVQKMFARLKTFGTFYTELKKIVNVTDDNGTTFLSKLPTTDREVITSLIKELQPLKVNLDGIIGTLEKERGEFETILDAFPITKELYEEERKERLNTIALIVNAQKEGAADTGITEETTRELNKNRSIREAFSGQGITIQAGIQTIPDALEDISDDNKERIKVWEEAMAKAQAFTFSIPPDLALFHTHTVESVRASLEEARKTLPDNARVYQPPLNEIINRALRKKVITEEMEGAFFTKLAANSQQKWEEINHYLLEGSDLFDVQFSDVTQLGGELNLTGDIVHRNTLSHLRFVRRQGDQIICETKDQIVVFQKSSVEDSVKRIYLLVWDKKASEKGALSYDKPFSVPFTNPRQSGVLLNYSLKPENKPNVSSSGAEIFTLPSRRKAAVPSTPFHGLVQQTQEKVYKLAA